jgi:pimeloyl-ACP methyl ester carboxylesterase
MRSVSTSGRWGCGVHRLPVVYVRGFAGKRGIEAAVEDPFYGFNEGSVHIRVGRSGDPSFYQFESPLLRLMIDEGYDVLVRGSQHRYLQDAASGSLPRSTVWVHRFYDRSAPSLTRDAHRPAADEELEDPAAYRSFELERAAEDLFELIQLVKDRTGAPRVFLVAHSMGGLICRCLLQKVLPDRGEAALDHVDRLFTYGTPHGGIHFDVGFGLFERVRDATDVAGAAVFGPRRMFDYLTPSAAQTRQARRAFEPAALPEEAFPHERVFCLVGTNPGDYEVAFGLSAKAVGPKSDGLVQVDHALVPGARFAFVHRSHSGRYGMVNSEEGYQNLHRFLFGDLEVSADLVGLDIPGTPDDGVVWQAETKLAIRGLPIVMHEQQAAHHCPIQLERGPGRSLADRPVPLVTTYLSADPARRPSGDSRMRYLLQVRILSLRERDGIFSFVDHLEQSADFDDTLVVDVAADGGMALRAWATWASTIRTPLRDHVATGDPLVDDDERPGAWHATVPLPSPSGDFLGPRASVGLTVRARDL